MIQELIRMQHICRERSGHGLRDYSVNIRKGEILYIQGVAGSGKHTLADILTGRETDYSGRVYYEGQKCEKDKLSVHLRQEVYEIGDAVPLAEKMSVMDNLETIRPVRFVLQPYSARKIRSKTVHALDEYDVKVQPETKVQELSFLDMQKLCIVKLVSAGAKLIIINCVYNVYGEKDGTLLGEFMQQFCKKGISFLILSEKPNVFLTCADRVQVVRFGIDAMEWKAEDFVAMLLQEEREEKAEISQEKDESLPGQLIGLSDYEWERNKGAESFLKSFRRNNPQIWKDYVDIAIPENGGICSGRETVMIPQESGELLLENLSLEDNLSICAAERVGRGRLKIIHQNMQRVLVHDFLELIQKDFGVRHVQDLSRAEKKILSIHRWTITHPKALFLENPFWGLDFEETEVLNNYLMALRKRDIKIVIFTRYHERMVNNYDVVIYSREAKHALVK